MNRSFRVGSIVVSSVLALSGCAGGGATPQTATEQANQTQAVGAMLGAGTGGFTPRRPPAVTSSVTIFDRAAATAGGWQPVAGTAPFGSNGAGTALLMTDGTVMISDNSSNWYSLTPDDTGSYVNGTWSTKAALPSGYGPLYFGSAILPDGKMLVEGGEYNVNGASETNQGALYDPVANTWTSVSPPSGWNEIGDAQMIVLPNGTAMLGNCCTKVQALFNEATLTWTPTGAGKNDANSEEGWTLLPDNDVLTSDVLKTPHAEQYNPSSGSWSTAGTLVSSTVASTETGPSVLRPNGTAFFVGANGNNAVYTVASGAWSAGPASPKNAKGKFLDEADGPATVLNNGNVFLAMSPGVYQTPVTFHVFNGTSFTTVPGTPNAKNDSSYNMRTLLLPTGQVLVTDGSNDVEIYSPNTTADKTIAPSVTSVPSSLTRGSTYTATGVRFNGFTAGNAYGDDAQAAENYPLVELVNASTGHVFFARTHAFSSMGVASQASGTAAFDVPAGMETGAASLYVVTDGVKSAAVSVTVQ